jgi:hypothetical protein
MAHVLCVLDNQGYRHTLRICNTSCFCMATMVMQMCLNIMFRPICTLPVSLKLLSCFVPVCDVLGSHSGMAENSGFLGCNTVLLDEQFPTLWRIIVPSYSYSGSSSLVTYSRDNSESERRRLVSSATPLLSLASCILVSTCETSTWCYNIPGDSNVDVNESVCQMTWRFSSRMSPVTRQRCSHWHVTTEGTCCPLQTVIDTFYVPRILFKFP